MGKCIRCNNSGIFLPISYMGLCRDCENQIVKIEQKIYGPFIITHIQKMFFCILNEMTIFNKNANYEEEVKKYWAKKNEILDVLLYFYYYMIFEYIQERGQSTFRNKVLSEEFNVTLVRAYYGEIGIRRIELTPMNLMTIQGKMITFIAKLRKIINTGGDFIEETALEITSAVCGERLNPVSKQIYDLVKFDYEISLEVLLKVIKQETNI